MRVVSNYLNVACLNTQGVYSPYGTNVDGGYADDMMGVAYGAPQTPAQPNPATPAYPYQYSAGGWRGQGGYVAPVYPNTTTFEAQ